MLKNFLYFCLLIPVLIKADIINAEKIFRVSAPSYPITVTAEKQKTASEIIFFCESYLNYLKHVWGINPKQIKPLSIIIKPKLEKDNFPEIIHSNEHTKFYTDTTGVFFRQTLCAFLADYFIKAALSVDKNKSAGLPQCIAIGISGTFLKEKIDPVFTNSHKSLVEGKLIPFEQFIDDSSYNYKIDDNLFVLQSIYFVNFLISQNFGKLFFIKFLRKYCDSPEKGITFLFDSFHVSSIYELEKIFLKQMTRKLTIYNVLSTQKKYTPDSILFLLDEILIFQYYDNDSGYVSIKGADLNVADIPLITKPQIYQKIIQLNVLTGSSPEKFHPVIKEYIKALNYLMKGKFNEYRDCFYKAFFLKDLLKRNKYHEF